MPIDREATLKQAEKLLRQGKLDAAIAEYVRLVQDQPRDWTTVNALGDLYVRAGDRDRAVVQFTQVADFMFAEGFLPKASALYKKALKVKPDHEHTLLRLSEIASRQGLLTDARHYLRQLDRLRRDRGDSRGTADILVRLAQLDEADAETILAGARAAGTLGDPAQAVVLLKSAAEALTEAGRRADAVAALSEAAALAPADQDLRRQLAREAVAAGQIDRVQSLLTRESAGRDPELLLALARRELASGNTAEARAALTRLITVAPDRSDVLLNLARELAEAGSVDAAFTCTQVLVDDALLAADWDRALSALQAFSQHRSHIPALVMLAELAGDARRDDIVRDAEAKLADAYVAAGRAEEARAITERLPRHPKAEADAEPQPGKAAAERPSGEPIADFVEIDLSGALAELGAASAVLPPAPLSPAEEPVTPPADLESVFEEIRTRVAAQQPGGDGREYYDRALQQLDEGHVPEAIANLRAAARMPVYRFRASARLGRLYIERGEPADGIEWLERAAEAPAPSADEGAAVLYDLASALEKMGESARALAVFMEVAADAPSYRDVHARIEHLSRVQAGRA